ncbi:MAG: VanZ family protein [Propionibacteriales bacterium]|nr:VanZ family protein [Propionibacteriales bacterium]
MTNYLSAFTTPWVLTGGVVVVVAALLLTWLVRRPLATTGRRAAFFGFAATGGAVAVVTLFREPPQIWCTSCLVADWGLPRLLNGQLGTEGLLNVALFVPVAFFAVLVWRTPVVTVLVAALGSLLIELLQPMWGVGVNDLTDLVTNLAGAMIGSAAAAVVLLIADSLTARRFLTGRTVRVVVGLLVVAAVVIGIPVGLATYRQNHAHAQLTQLFAGTTVADYHRHADTDWVAKERVFKAQNGTPSEVGYATSTVARTRYTWTTFGLTHCLTAEWTRIAFSVTDEVGANCRTPFHS